VAHEPGAHEDIDRADPDEDRREHTSRGSSDQSLVCTGSFSGTGDGATSIARSSKTGKLKTVRASNLASKSETVKRGYLLRKRVPLSAATTVQEKLDLLLSKNTLVI
jgi:hypothetical protein